MKRKNPRDEFQENWRQEKDDNERFSRQKFERRERARSFLPEPEVLENYNYVIEGSAERILKLIEDEQKHRHRFELNQQKYVAFVQMLGIIGVVVVAYTIVNSAVYLGANGQFYLALALCVSGFAYLGGAVLINFNQTRRSKDYGRRKNYQNQQQYQQRDQES